MPAFAIITSPSSRHHGYINTPIYLRYTLSSSTGLLNNIVTPWLFHNAIEWSIQTLAHDFSPSPPSCHSAMLLFRLILAASFTRSSCALYAYAPLLAIRSVYNQHSPSSIIFYCSVMPLSACCARPRHQVYGAPRCIITHIIIYVAFCR